MAGTKQILKLRGVNNADVQIELADGEVMYWDKAEGMFKSIPVEDMPITVDGVSATTVKGALDELAARVIALE